MKSASTQSRTDLIQDAGDCLLRVMDYMVDEDFGPATREATDLVKRLAELTDE
jgi:hypothetical protein